MRIIILIKNYQLGHTIVSRPCNSILHCSVTYRMPLVDRQNVPRNGTCPQLMVEDIEE